MKKIILGLLFSLSVLSQAEIKVQIHSPIRFKNVNTQAYGDLIVGQGALEIYSTKFEEDVQKKIKIRFPDTGLMTNKKRWIKVEKYKMAEKDQEFVMDREKKIVNFYAFVRRRKLNEKETDGALVEGEYVGYVPIVIEQYGQPINPKPTPLPVFPDEDRPNILPSFPDEPGMERPGQPTPLPLSRRGRR